MKIAGCQTHAVRITAEDNATGTHVVLRLRTDEGIEGVAYISRLNDQTLGPVRTLVEQMVGGIVGEPALDTEGLYRRLYRHENPASSLVGLEARAASGIDIALWDIKGKALGQPVFRLLGGSNNRVPVSANWGVDHGVTAEVLAQRVQERLDRGFRGFKFRIGHLDQATAVEHLRAVRDLVGPDVKLMVDGNFKWTVKQALAMADALAPYDPHWIEDPVAYHDLEALREVKDQIPALVCAGEAFQTLPPHRELLENQCSDIVMVDMDLGLSGFQRVAALAEFHRTPIVNHLACEMLAHGVAAAPTGYIAGFNPWAQPLFTEPVTIEDGDLVLPERPGIGLELDEAALEHYAIR